MSELFTMLGVTLAVSLISLFLFSETKRLKAISAIWLVSLIISLPMINTEWARMTSELVAEEGDPHYGLPDIWDGEQVVCIHFPDNSTHAEFNDGRHHIDSDGTDFMTDADANFTGVCIGGFSGYENGFDLLLAFAICLLALDRNSQAAKPGWPQLQGNAERSGNAPHLSLSNSIGLVKAIPLTDAVFTSPVIGDGKIFITAVEQAIRIRTGETGNDAI